MADINIGGTLHSVATGNVVARAEEILDREKNKKQDLINQETDQKIGALEEAVGTGGSIDARIEAAVDVETQRAIEAENARYTKEETYSKEEADAAISGAIEDCAYLGDDDGQAVIPDFDPQADALWKGEQVLSNAEKAQVKENLGLDDDLENIEGEISTLGATVFGHTTAIELLQELYRGLSQSDIVVVDDHTAVVSPQENTIYREPGDSSYTDWMYYNESWEEMATYNNAIDDEPTAGSDNLVKSGGVAGALDKVSKISKEIISEEDDSISVEDEDGNKVIDITPNGVDAKNLKSNGKNVLTSDDAIDKISSGTTSDDTKSIEITDDSDVCKTRFTDYGIQSKAFNLLNPFKSIRDTKNLSSGQKIELEDCHIHGNKKLNFMANISSMTSFKIGIGTTSYWSSYFVIDSTSIVLKNYTDSEKTTTVSFTHGLTFANNISVAIAVDNNGNLTIDLASNGYKYTGTINVTGNISTSIIYSYFLGVNGKAFVEATNAAFTDAVLSFTCKGWDKKIHVYGDSYVSLFNGTRPYYYLAQNDYLENVLLNAFPGEASLAAIQDLQRNLTHSTPQYIVWAVGMNDLDVSDTVPSVNWLNGVNTLLSECNKRGIVPILCTIPSVIGGYSPDSGIGDMRIHKAKNDWVRNSGYRYIDFAKAVGASDVNGTWFNNGEDNDFLESGDMRVHPTQYGALALYYQILADFSEITNN